MRSKLFALLLLCSSLLSFTRGNPDPVFAPAYFIFPLGTPPNMDSAEARSINNQGDIVGQVMDASAFGTGTPCVWRNGRYDTPELITNKPVQLQLLGGETFDINERGDVIGYAMFGSRESGSRGQGFVETTGKITFISEQANPVRINNEGVVVGTIRIESQNGSEHRGFVWQSGTFQLLPSPGGNNTEVCDVNDKGEIVGYTDLEESNAAGKPENHAWLWRNGEIIELGDPGVFYGINNQGELAGSSHDTIGREKAVVRRDGKTTDLECTASSEGCAATNINNQGMVLGYIKITKADHHIALWHKGKRLDVTTRLLNLQGWGKLVATSINDKGEIVGYGDYEGVRSAFVILPLFTMPNPTM